MNISKRIKVLSCLEEIINSVQYDITYYKENCGDEMADIIEAKETVKKLIEKLADGV